jgi:hypothetical protein
VKPTYAELGEMLRSLEFSFARDSASHPSECPECRAESAHAEDCELGQLLARLDDGGEDPAVLAERERCLRIAHNIEGDDAGWVIAAIADGGES